MNRRTIRRLAVIGAMALAGSGLGASETLAGEPQQISTQRGAAWFDPDGDHLYVIDTNPDGLGVMARLTWNRTRSESVMDRGAQGPPKHRNLNLHEGELLELELCTFRKSGLVACTRPQEAIA